MNAAIIIPTYNERDNLGALVSAILQHAGYRIIVVDDDSPDGTGALADELAAAYPDTVSVIHRRGARGLGRSIVAGLQRALESGAELIFQMDADFSHDPKYLPDMAAATSDADLVLGSRNMHVISVVNWPSSCTSPGASAAGCARCRSSSWNDVRAPRRSPRACCWSRRSCRGDCA